MNSLSHWIKASRLQSQSYIFFPLLLGQVLSVAHGYRWNWWIFALVHVYGLCMQVYIVYANDYADIETDKLNTTYTIFSGGSRVIVEGMLSARETGVGALVMALLTALSGVAGGVFFGRVLMVPLAIVSLLLLWMYSYRPIQLSYRGGGEFLQMIGVGFVLPLMGYYGQSGQIATFPWLLLAALLPANLACGMATSLPDEPSDRMSNKRTSSVILGPKRNAIFIVVLNTVSVVVLVFLAFRISVLPFSWVLLVPLIPVVAQVVNGAGAPGTIERTIFVALSVICTLAISVVIILAVS